MNGMASRVLSNENAMKSLVSSFKKCISGNRAQATVHSRKMLTAAERNYPPEEDNTREIERRDRGFPGSRRTDLNALFNDAWDPFLPSRSLSQAVDAMNAFFENPLLRGQRGGGLEGNPRTPWDAKEDDDAFRLRLDMPGLGKEDVELNVEDNTLIIKGEPKAEGESDGRKYSSRIELPKDLYNAAEIKAKMQNGVLRITVPKIRKEELKNVVEVKVD